MRFAEYLSEGWGAGAQKRELERHNKEWTELFNKYAQDKKTTAKLKDLKMKNWKASAAAERLGLIMGEPK